MENGEWRMENGELGCRCADSTEGAEGRTMDNGQWTMDKVEWKIDEKIDED